MKEVLLTEKEMVFLVLLYFHANTDFSLSVFFHICTGKNFCIQSKYGKIRTRKTHAT